MNDFFNFVESYELQADNSTTSDKGGLYLTKKTLSKMTTACDFIIGEEILLSGIEFHVA